MSENDKKHVRISHKTPLREPICRVSSCGICGWVVFLYSTINTKIKPIMRLHYAEYIAFLSDTTLDKMQLYFKLLSHYIRT